MAKKKNEQEDSFDSIDQSLSKTEQFIEKNQKLLSTIFIVIFLVIGGYLGFKKYYLKPLEEEAISQMFAAEQYFEKDSFNLAINGDGNMPGFLEIIDDYGMTKAANLANYYTGISYLHLGQYDEAISYLQDFSADDRVISIISTGAIGDAYMGMGQTEDAAKKYIAAASMRKNEFISPIYLMKAGRAYELLGNWAEALKQYEKIKKDFPSSNEARMVDKFIKRAELKSK